MPKLEADEVAAFTGHSRPTDPTTRVFDALPPELADRVPWDVCDHIISSLVGDQDALCRLALVSRAWNERATAVLFSDVTIRSSIMLDSLARLAVQDPRVRAHLAKTRMLRLRQRTAQEKATAFVHAVPLVLGTLLPGLRCVKMEHCPKTAVHPTFFISLPVFKSVTSLKLCFFLLHSFSELRRIICAFPQLRTLSIHYANVLQSTTRRTALANAHSLDRALPRSSVKLEYLSLGWDMPASLASELVDWLVGSSALDALSMMELYLREPERMPPMNRLLEAAGSSLLWLREVYWDVDTDLKLHCALTPNTNLQSIEVNLGSTSWAGAALELLTFLQTVQSTQLQRLRIWIQSSKPWTPEGEHPDSMHSAGSFRVLHAELARKAFDALQSVRVVVTVHYDDERWDRLAADAAADNIVTGIRVLLAPWDARGVLETVRMEWRDRPVD
ncbi:uncharacterized protein B0H18DRAFT_1042851 [Fomitopsis serialis]|uniref:uncharacterized protein n=1 Tax=Fomitopsis serialis TaxID=139415 RepID=UPI0020078EAA|nr:uncharacterized protein B0H18DRAFT_1042851 [Neoantrodia serialis]KAH9915087.1 hypothetical protein B0H18DRAFT_1042851 [Neoantrodia serialis]